MSVAKEIRESLSAGIQQGYKPTLVTLCPEYMRKLTLEVLGPTGMAIRMFDGVTCVESPYVLGRYLVEFDDGTADPAPVTPTSTLFKTCVCGSHQPAGRGHSTWCDVYA